MAATLSPFTFKWSALNVALNKIVDAINRNAPLEGDNIQLDEKGQHGVSINAVRSKNAGTGQQSDGNATGGAVSGPYTITINDVDWKSVTVVDPVSCAQSTIMVLIQSVGSTVTLNATLTPVTT